ncbi:MAG: hypothetical protein M3N00_03060, partial [Actinomycetota bacterium]|nr:hypothetical protein [Actinomycetota bacterium]
MVHRTLLELPVILLVSFVLVFGFVRPVIAAPGGAQARGVSSISTRSILSPGSRSLWGSRSRMAFNTSI